MKYYLASLVLVFFASIKVLADIAGWSHVSALAAATNLAPAMKVFTAHQGYETYSSTYLLSVVYPQQIERILFTPQTYAAIRGPYNRRNVYGALIAYGPVLNAQPALRPMWETIAKRTFCRDSALLKELNISYRTALVGARIDYLNTRNPQHFAQHLEVKCE